VAADVAAPLLRILAGLHAPGVVHRDLKPEHIVRGPDGLKLVDWVLAADLAQERPHCRCGGSRLPQACACAACGGPPQPGP
jgi:serine/threonine protein kinase